MTKKVCCSIKALPNDGLSKNLNPIDYLNSKDVLQLKKDLLNGKKNKACSACWIKEAKGIKSLRIGLNQVLTNQKFYEKNWIDSYFKQANDKIKTKMLLSADVKMGNTCNHACVMCRPADSSLVYNDWMSKHNSSVVQGYLKKDPNYLNSVKTYGYKNSVYIDYLKQVIDSYHSLKSLKFLGGETLLDRKLLNLLRNIPQSKKDQIKINVVTNGSIDLEWFCKYIGEFRHVSCSISVEGVEELQEWARYGSNWKYLEKNILNALDKTNLDITILHTFQTATVLGFGDLADWCKKNGLKLLCSLVEDPEELSLASLPSHLKTKIISSLKQNKDSVSSVENTADEEFLDYHNLVSGVEHIQYSAKMYEKFKTYIEWYENNKKVTPLKDIFPELFNLKV